MENLTHKAPARKAELQLASLHHANCPETQGLGASSERVLVSPLSDDSWTRMAPGGHSRQYR